MARSAAYDIGGAHLKVAVAEDGRTIAVRQIPCALWLGLDLLDDAFAEMSDLLSRVDIQAATMTGEMCELFPDRRAGVGAILNRLEQLRGSDIQIWMGMHGLGNLGAARRDPMSVASTNFLATAALVACRIPDALLIDMGSTTTDILAVRGGTVAACGLTDGERLRTGELVYTGTTRTEVSSVAPRAHLNGQPQRLAAGGFANMADVRRVLGILPDDVDQYPTLDGRGKTEAESRGRLARCFGRDATDASKDVWRDAAGEIRAQQMAEIERAAKEVMSRTDLARDAPLVAAGIGASEVRDLASSLGRRAIAFGTLADAAPECEAWATRCAPAAAVALLAQR